MLPEVLVFDVVLACVCVSTNECFVGRQKMHLALENPYLKGKSANQLQSLRGTVGKQLVLTNGGLLCLDL